MAFKFPFTNYHELNLTWVLDQLKSLFEKSEENVTVIENYNGRLTAVETELPLVEETAQGASQQAASAATLAQQAKSTADTAQENAIQAQGLAGTARQEAQQAQAAADAATQAAQQAQATAQNFDGRITQAENDASQALEASRSFENRVQSAITTANNAAQTATNAQGIATRADQNAALALDTLNAQRSELERIGAEQVERITEETENGKAEIEGLIDTLPADFTELVELVDKKAPVIINSASGAVASFNDGADNMKIQKLVVNIEPLQAGSGDPSPTNIRPFSGWTGADIMRAGKNLFNKNASGINPGHALSPNTGSEYSAASYSISDFIKVTPGNSYVTSGIGDSCDACFYNSSKQRIAGVVNLNNGAIAPENAVWIKFDYKTANADIVQLESNTAATDYAPYTVNSISIDWETDAGTVYGTTLTINSDGAGILLVKRVIYDGGNLSWTKITGSSFRNFVANPLSSIVYSNSITTVWSSAYKGTNNNAASAGDDNYTWANSNFPLNRIAVKDTSKSGMTAEEFKTAMTGVQFLCELEKPVTYTLASTQISGILKTLYGQNNIWANTGDIAVDYPADTKLYIDGKLAELQATILENI